MNITSLRRLVEHTISAGCPGMPGLAVAGQSSTLRQDEKLRFTEVVTQANAGRILFIASVTAQDPAAGGALARKAHGAGATGLCVQLPAGSHRSDS